jgi:hypothetical protein
MLEVADIVRAEGAAYRQRLGSRMLPSHHQAMRDIEQCRTAALGGHVRHCDACGSEHYSYHSCRNRHCPKCQHKQSLRWLERQRDRALPCPYFFVTFTLPHALHPVARGAQRTVYDAMMRCATQTLLEVAANAKHLGARPGLIAVLHTWRRDLGFHPHVHILCTGGGWSDEEQRWRDVRNPAYFAPQRVLATVFRAKLRDALAQAPLTDHVAASVWKKRKRWIVDCRYVGNGDHVFEYLSRYVFRTAICNSRLVRFENRHVTFRYRHRQSGETRHMTLHAHAFLRRLLQHVVPRHFVRVRHCGLFASACGSRLEQARRQLETTSRSSPTPRSHAQRERVDRSATPPDPDPVCPICKRGHLRITSVLKPTRAPP